MTTKTSSEDSRLSESTKAPWGVSQDLPKLLKLNLCLMFTSLQKSDVGEFGLTMVARTTRRAS